MEKRDIQLTPEWKAADALAQTMFEQRFPGAPWRGRKTNRAYWRRLAKGELHRLAAPLDDRTGGDEPSGECTPNHPGDQQ